MCKESVDNFNITEWLTLKVLHRCAQLQRPQGLDEDFRKNAGKWVASREKLTQKQEGTITNHTPAQPSIHSHTSTAFNTFTHQHSLQYIHTPAQPSIHSHTSTAFNTFTHQHSLQYIRTPDSSCGLKTVTGHNVLPLQWEYKDLFRPHKSLRTHRLNKMLVNGVAYL